MRAPSSTKGEEPERARCSRPAGRAHAMSITWYLIVSALIFCIGAGGVLTRRNPLVILLCLELMLNAANLALVAFARAHGDMGGQIFALMVMVVAACEVAVGLGLVVAHLPPAPADRRRRACGSFRDEHATYGWLVLLFPLAGCDPDRAHLQGAAARACTA